MENKDNRYIPEDIRKYLRKEVGYGCPIEGCRSPFLEYHHFDPKFKDGGIHRKEGMIAMCPSHHRKADIDTWTNEELYKLKNNQYKEKVKGIVEWDMKKCIVFIGSNIFFGETFSCIINDIEIFSLKQNSDGHIYINAVLLDDDCNIISKILNNDILTNISQLGDLECTPSGSEIKINSNNNTTNIHIHFKKQKTDIFDYLLNRATPEVKFGLRKDIHKKVIDGKVLTLTFQAKIITNLFSVIINENFIDFDFSKLGLPDIKAKIHGAVFSKAGLCIQTNSNKKILVLGEINY